MSQLVPPTVLPFQPGESRWRSLYRIAAVVALLSVVIFLFQMISFFLWPPPATVAQHFTLLHSRPFIGLVSLDFFIIVDEVLAIPLLLALYLCLRRFDESVMLIATALSAAATMCFLIATPALNMLYLSQQYATVSTSIEREEFLAAGQAALSAWMGTPFQVGNVVGSIAMMLVGWVMLRSQIFSKAAAVTGILAGAVGLGMYVPKVGVYISIFSVVGMQVWYVLIARTFFRITRYPRMNG